MNETMKRILIVLLAVLFAGPAVSSVELLLPIPGASGRGVRYFADHELSQPDPKTEYAVVAIHGASGGSSDYAQRLRKLVKEHPLADKVLFVAPCFPVKSMLSEDDRRRIAYWEHCEWQAGNDSPVADTLSSYDVLDMVFNHLNDIRIYPNLKHVLFCGYSAGGQVVCRYMAVSGIKPRDGLSVGFAAGAPSSWLFLDRSVEWHCGLANRNRYASRVSDEDIFKNINDRFILCFCGTADTGTKSLDVRPLAMAQGATRYERFKNFRKHIATFPKLKESFSFVEVEGLGHSGKCWGSIGIDKLIFGERNATAAAGPTVDNPHDGFVTLAEAVPDAILEIRYYSTYNFVGERIDGYEQPCALLSKEAAKALKAASDDCIRRGYRLKIYDAYRPQRAVAHFVRWAADVGDTRMKAPFYPNLDKSVLFKQGYIAERSGHSRGSTVDLTLFDMKTGKEVDMGGTFDWFGEESHPSYHGITDAQFKNRMLLRDVMGAHGFKPLEEEWWHFTLANEPYPDTYFDFPVRESQRK